MIEVSKNLGRFLIFSAEHYESMGGSKDLVGVANTKTEILQMLPSIAKHWVEIVDLGTGQRLYHDFEYGIINLDGENWEPIEVKS